MLADMVLMTLGMLIFLIGMIINEVLRRYSDSKEKLEFDVRIYKKQKRKKNGNS